MRFLMAKNPEKYSANEAQRRFEVALRGGLNTPPKPLKTMTSKTKKARQKKSLGCG
jgi:hypothetical protein